MAGTLPPLRLVLAILRIGLLLFSVASCYKLSELDNQLQDMPKAPWRMHTLFSVECRDYFDWQTVGLIHSLKKSGQPGPFTRLLSCTDEDLLTYKGHDLAPTLNVPSMSKNPVNGDWYPAINKPAAVVHWLKHSEDAKNVDWVVILDADMIMRRPITPWDVGAEKGKPVSASYGYLVGCDNELATIHTTHPEFCDKVGGFIVMHIDDLRAMAPLWLSKTQEVRADTDHWATKYTGDIYSSGWISEMYGYSFGAAEVGLRHKINDDLMIYPGYIPLPGKEPSVLHYGLRFNVSSWYFEKADHLNNRIVYECNKLFLPPPYPEQVERIAKSEEVRRALLLSIECMNTLNEGLVLHHAKRGCPKPSKTEYLEFLLSGSDPSSRQRLKVVEQNGSEDATRQERISSEEVVRKSSVPNELKLPHPRIHTLFSTECTDYFDWQTLGLYHSLQLSGQPGLITRLLSCTEEKLATYKNMDLAPTHVVPSYSVHPLTGDRYPAINKPVGVLHWLNHVKMDVEYVVILDADMILRGPVTPWEFGASRGKPVSVSYNYLIGCDNELARLHTRYPEYCQKVGGIIIMHIEDLRLFAPLWVSKTEEVRADKAHWATDLTGDVYGMGWISEMYGYVFGAAELKLQHIIRDEIMIYPGYIPPPGIEVRVLHYGLNFTVGNWSWDKHSWRDWDMTSKCWTQFPSPPDPSTLKWASVLEEKRDRLSIECMKTLNEALYLYHKRKGCQLESRSDGMKDGGQSVKFRHEAEEMNSREEAVDGGNFKGSGGFELGFNHDDVLESLEERRAEADRLRQTLRKRLATDLTSRASAAMNPRYWMVALWISACILFWAVVMLGVSTVYSRSRGQGNNKQRHYKVKPRRFDTEFRKERLEVRLPELHP